MQAQQQSQQDQEQSFSLNTPVLSTEHLVLRMPTRDDIDELAELANNPEIAEMTSRLPYPYTREHAEQFVEAILNGSASGYIYAVTHAETGHLIGMCGVEMRARSNGLEVGYWIGRKWWGHGYATEASKAVVDLAFKVTGTDEIFAACRPHNDASKKVLLKQGFSFIGRDEVDTVASGRVTVDRYRVTRTNWLLNISSGQDDAA